MGVVVAIITDGNKVLIGKLRAEKLVVFGGVPYIFPGGKQEDNENLEQATIREVKEETGLTARIVRQIGTRIHPKSGKEIVYFHCEKISGDLSTDDAKNNDIDVLLWVDRGQLSEYMPTLFDAVQDYLKTLSDDN